MRNSTKIFYKLAILASVFILSTISSTTYAYEQTTAVVTEVENPTINETEDKTFYTQRVLLRIHSGPFKGTEEETIYTFPSKSMGRALKVGDQVVIEINPENLSQRITIKNFNRSRYLFFAPIVLAVIIIFLLGRSRPEDLFVTGGVIAIPTLTVLSVKYLHWLPITGFVVSTLLLSTSIFLLKFKRQITLLAAMASFLISMFISGAIVYVFIETLNIWGGILSTYLPLYNITPQKINLSNIIFVMLLTILWAPIVTTVYTTITDLIQLYTQEQITNRSELVKKNISRTVVLVKNAIFIPLSIGTGLGMSLILLGLDQLPISQIFDDEILAFLSAIILSPIFGIVTSMVVTSILCIIIFSISAPHRIISDKEATMLIPIKTHLTKKDKKIKKKEKEKPPLTTPIEKSP